MRLGTLVDCARRNQFVPAQLRLAGHWGMVEIKGISWRQPLRVYWVFSSCTAMKCSKARTAALESSVSMEIYGIKPARLPVLGRNDEVNQVTHEQFRVALISATWSGRFG
jgi:hypothetical protein